MALKTDNVIESAAPATPVEPARPATSAADRRRPERRAAEPQRAEPVRTAAPPVERRQADRRGMDALRAEALRTVMTRVEDKNFGGLRNRTPIHRGITLPRIMLLVVALLAGGAAAYLATQSQTPAPVPVKEIAVAPTVQVLVAKQAIGAGKRLSSESVGWVDWPEAALNPEYITVAATPEAITDLTGMVVRSDFIEGEPIRQEKLTSASGGYLSAVLDKGMRGVSVPITADSASGGFVAPDDHVDVVLTRSTDMGQDSQTILYNVRVLAIGAQFGDELGVTSGTPTETGDASGAKFADHTVATLALNPTQAEVIINAVMLGKLTFVLRPITENDAASTPAQLAANAAIRLSSPFWAK